MPIKHGLQPYTRSGANSSSNGKKVQVEALNPGHVAERFSSDSRIGDRPTVRLTWFVTQQIMKPFQCRI